MLKIQNRIFMKYPNLGRQGIPLVFFTVFDENIG
jgi:hypothetical protein